jgi:hypothetical protein
MQRCILMYMSTTSKQLICRKGCGFERGTYDCVMAHKAKPVMQPRGRHALSVSKDHFFHATVDVPTKMYKQAWQGWGR